MSVPLFMAAVLLSSGCSQSAIDLRLEYGCRGLLQSLSSDGDGLGVDFGSGSGDIPAMIVWMDMCSKEFGQKEAEVVCRQLGCGSDAKHVHPSRFNVTSSDIIPFLVTSFPYNCSGLESSLEECHLTHTTCKLFDNNSADIIALECAEPTTSEEEVEDTNSPSVNSSSSTRMERFVHTETLLTTLLMVYFS